MADAKEQQLKSLLEQARALFRETSPITPEMVEAVPTWRAAYSDRSSALMASLCEIAYDRFEDTTGLGREMMERRLATGGFRLLGVYDVNACTQAYLATSSELAVLAFRGTESAADWKINLSDKRVPMDTAVRSPKVHSGFLHAFQSVEKQIRADLDEHVPHNRGLYITGHSLGGALAQIASAAFERDNLAACYTYGSPRVGGQDFDDLVRCPHYRMVNRLDLVPGVPPIFWRGYRHSGDVRTLGELGARPVRRSRPVLQGFLKSVLAVFALLRGRKFVLIDDHMIWNYEAKLLKVVVDRTGAGRVTAQQANGAPMEAAEVAARLETAIYRAARLTGRKLAEGVEVSLPKLARPAAERILKETTDPTQLAARVAESEVAFERVIAAMEKVAKDTEGYPADILGDATLRQAQASLAPLFPIW